MAKQFTLSQPGGQIIPNTVLPAPPDFQTLRRAWFLRIRYFTYLLIHFQLIINYAPMKFKCDFQQTFFLAKYFAKEIRNCDVEFSKGNLATLLLFWGNYCTISLCTCGWAANNQQTRTKVRSIFEFRVGNQNWWTTLNLDQNHMCMSTLGFLERPQKIDEIIKHIKVTKNCRYLNCN